MGITFEVWKVTKRKGYVMNIPLFGPKCYAPTSPRDLAPMSSRALRRLSLFACKLFSALYLRLQAAIQSSVLSRFVLIALIVFRRREDLLLLVSIPT